MAAGIIFILCAMIIVAAFILTRHRERMTIIEKGVSPEDAKALYSHNPFGPVSPLSSLKWGLLLTMVGIGVMLGLYLREAYYVSEGVVPGLMVLFGGIGLIVFYFIANKKSPQQ